MIRPVGGFGFDIELRRFCWDLFRFIWLYHYDKRNLHHLKEFLERIENQESQIKAKLLHAQGISSKRYYTNFNTILWDLLTKLLTTGRRRCDIPEQLTILTCTNRHNIGSLELSLKRLLFPPARFHILGAGISPWENIKKIRLIDEFVPSIKTDYALYADSHDVLAVDLSGIDIVLDEFRCDMLFAAERQICYPCNLNRAAEISNAKRLRKTKRDYFFLNSGLWIARTNFLHQIIKEGLSIGPYGSMPSDDQAIYKMLLSRHGRQIRVDYDGEVFQTIQFANLNEIFDI